MTQFDHNRQPDPKKRSGGPKGKYKKLQDAIERLFSPGMEEDDQTFYSLEDYVVYKSIKDGGVYFQELLRRYYPPHKPTYELVEFDLPDNATPKDKADAVFSAMASGILSADIGESFISSIGKLISIDEYTELRDRIEKLEKALKETD